MDTCCIKKESSTDLSEAINSMFQWYRDAEHCYVYLHDVQQKAWQDMLPRSVWFTRGWTLQELLAPRKVLFYDQDWQFLGDKCSLVADLSRITGIDQAALETGNLCSYSIAQKMSWAARRITTRIEDGAYCLLGLFDINMPPMYGEGKKAFLRLQEEIIKNSDDHSIFAWSMGNTRFSGLLAPEPTCFAGSGQATSDTFRNDHTAFTMTNRGLSITLEVTPWSADTYLAYLNCAQVLTSHAQVQVGILLRRLSEHDQYARINLCQGGLWFDTSENSAHAYRPRRMRPLLVRKTVDEGREEECLKKRTYGIQLPVKLLPLSTHSDASKDRFVRLKPGGWGEVTVVDLSREYRDLRHIALGFDFDFNPVCLLENSCRMVACSSEDGRQCFDWFDLLLNDEGWESVHAPGDIYRKQMANGICAVKGHRLTGLDIIFGESFTNNGLLLSIQRDKSQPQLVWDLDLDSLIGPFRNHRHRRLKHGYTDRRNFQAVWRLSMSEEDLDEGDNILKGHYGVVERDLRRRNSAS